MEFVQEKIDDITILRIKRERLDSNIAPDLKATLLMLHEENIHTVLVDISNVYYADSSGLGALLFGLRQFRDQNGTLKLIGANSRVLNLIRIAKLEDILINFTNEREAINSINFQKEE